MALNQQLQATFLIAMLLLITMMSLATAQSLQLVYRRRLKSGTNFQPGDNRIVLQCNPDVSYPQIWVERSDLASRQPVRIENNQDREVTIVINQDIEGLYSCSDNGDRSTNTLKLVAYPRANLLIPSSYAFQAGQPATIDCRVMPGRLSQYYRVTWWNGNLTIATSNPHSVLPGYQLHDNFSLTINDIQLSDSSTSYRCSVIIDDPRISGTTGDFFYNRHQLGSISVAVYDSPSIAIPLEPRVIAVVGSNQPNTTFICEATKISTCIPQISWIHNGNESTDQRFRASITGNTERTIRSTLNATQLRGRDSGRIDCVASCTVVVPNVRRPLVLTTFRNTTLSVLTGDFNIVVSTTTARDMLIRINFQDGYRILDQTRLLMKYTDERSTESMNMTSEEAYMNRNKILLEVPHSRLPYERFRVDVALQVGDEVGPFVPDGRIHDVTEKRTIIIAGSVVGVVVVIAALVAFLICCVCVTVLCNNRHKRKQQNKTESHDLDVKELEQMGETRRTLIICGRSPGEVKQHLADFTEEIIKLRNSRQRPDGDETDEEEIQKILSNFLSEMHKLPAMQP